MQLAASSAVPAWRRGALLRRLGIDVPASSMIAHGVYIGGPNVRIGADVAVNIDTILDGCADLVLEDHVRIGCRCTFITGTHTIQPGAIRRTIAEPLVLAPIRVGRGTWIGAGAVIVGPVAIGEGCVIAAGAVVTADCAPHGLYAGVPARRISELPVTTSEGNA